MSLKTTLVFIVCVPWTKTLQLSKLWKTYYTQLRPIVEIESRFDPATIGDDVYRKTIDSRPNVSIKPLLNFLGDDLGTGIPISTGRRLSKNQQSDTVYAH